MKLTSESSFKTGAWSMLDRGQRLCDLHNKKVVRPFSELEWTWRKPPLIVCAPHLRDCVDVAQRRHAHAPYKTEKADVSELRFARL